MMPSRCLAALVASLLASACHVGQQKASPPREAASSPDLSSFPASDPATLVYGRSEDSLTLDPAAASDGESRKVIDSIFETLFDFEGNPENAAILVPNLVLEWEHSADRMTWTFTLQEGVRFHDGTPLDAEAVKFSLERLSQPGHPFAPDPVPYGSAYRRIREVEVLEPTRFVIRLYEPSVILLQNLAMFPAAIVSPTAVKALGAAGFARAPVGSGPYRLASWRPGEIVLGANPTWWVDDDFAIRKVVFVALSDWAQRREALKAAQIDMADDVDINDMEWLEATPGIRLLRSPGMSVCYLAMNNEQPPLDDPQVRQAIAMSIDRERILRVGYAGSGLVALDLLPGNLEGSGKEVVPVRNVVAARELIQQAGDKMKEPLRLWYMTSQRPYVLNPPRVALILRDCLNEAGIKVELRSFEWTEYLQRLRDGEHQLALCGWQSDNGDADNFYTQLLSQASIGATNYVRLRNERFETLLAASREEEDSTTRSALFRRMQDILSRECPFVPLVHTSVTVACRSELRGFVPHPIRLRLYDVEKVDTK